jgi:hypothetical protein
MKSYRTYTKSLLLVCLLTTSLWTAEASTTLSIQLATSSDTGLSSSDGITFTKYPSFNGTGPSGTAIRVTKGTQTLCSTNINNTNSWTCTSTVLLPDGTHTITAQLPAQPGTTSTTTIVIDTQNTTPPQAPVINPLQVFGGNPSPMINSNTLNFTGTAEPGARVHILNETDNTSFCLALTNTNGTYNCTGLVPTQSNYTEVSFFARSTDKAGNISNPSESSLVVISLSNPPSNTPSTPILTQSSDTGVSTTDYYTSDTTPTFSGTGTPGLPLYITAGPSIDNPTVCITTVANDGTWECATTPLPSHPLAIRYFVRAHYSESLSSPAIEINIDNENRQATTKPAIKTEFNDGVSDADTITSKNPFRVWGYAENLVRIEVFVDSIFNCAVTSTGGGYWSCLLSVPGPGSYVIDAVETDKAGNLSPRSEILNATITP